MSPRLIMLFCQHIETLYEHGNNEIRIPILVIQELVFLS